MSRLTTSWMLLVLAAGLSAGAPLAAQKRPLAVQSPPTGIDGTITDSTMRLALAGVQVVMVVPGGKQLATVSGPDGRFRIDAPPGMYRLTARHIGYRTFEAWVAVVPGGRDDSYIPMRSLAAESVRKPDSMSRASSAAETRIGTPSAGVGAASVGTTRPYPFLEMLRARRDAAVEVARRRRAEADSAVARANRLKEEWEHALADARQKRARVSP